MNRLDVPARMLRLSEVPKAGNILIDHTKSSSNLPPSAHTDMHEPKNCLNSGLAFTRLVSHSGVLHMEPVAEL